MRALLFVSAIPLVACQAIVGTYEVAPEDAVAHDTNTDTAVTDTGGLVVTSCKQHKAAGVTASGRQTIIAPGSPGFKDGVFAFCEMMGPAGGGYTLVATRSSTTDGATWAGMGGPSAAVKRSVDLDLGPADDADAVLAIDWKLLGFSEVVYDLGASATPGQPPKTRVTFKDLNTDYVAKAFEALAKGHAPSDRPDCFLDMSTTAVKNCLGSAPPPDGMKALGWVYAPTNAQCYWAYSGQPGTKGCDGTTVGKGRVFVK